MTTTAAAARTEILAERASALLVVLDGSPENLRGKTRLGMALLAHLATELAGVPMFARNVGDVLDIAGVWRHHNASYTTSTHWLKPETPDCAGRHRREAPRRPSAGPGRQNRPRHAVGNQNPVSGLNPQYQRNRAPATLFIAPPAPFYSHVGHSLWIAPRVCESGAQRTFFHRNCVGDSL